MASGPNDLPPTPGRNSVPVTEKAWTVIEKHFDRNESLVAHQLNSFSEFINTGIPSVVNSFNPITINSGFNHETGKYASVFQASFANLSLGRCVTQDKTGKTTLLLPSDARLRNMVYASALTSDVEIEAFQTLPDGSTRTDTKVIKGVQLGNVPIMVGSEYCLLSDKRHRSLECPFDPTGYFIINGNEKVLISHDRIAENTPFVFSGSKNQGETLICEVRSVGERMPGCPKTTTLVLMAKPNPHGLFVNVSINSVKSEIPLFLLYRALGVTTDKAIVESVTRIVKGVAEDDLHRELQGSCAEGKIAWTQKDALRFLSKYVNLPANIAKGEAGDAQRVSVTKHILDNDLFPHVGPDFNAKAVYLSYMTAKLLKVKLGVLNMDDRDSYLNKRIDAPGALLTCLFRQHFAKMLREMRTFLLKELNSGTWKVSGKLANLMTKSNICKIVRHTTVSSGLMYALATGNWGIKNSRCKQGVAQVLNRMTYIATVSHLRRVNTPIEKTGKLVQPRKLFATSWGIICPAETPEGASIGLVKNLALTTVVTTHTPTCLVLDRLFRMGVRPIRGNAALQQGALVIVNGGVVGTHENPADMFAKLKIIKRRGILNPTTSVVWNPVEQELRMSTEAGRCCRPLLIVENGKALIEDIDYDTLKNMTVLELLTGRHRGGAADIPSVIEYVDVEEANQSLIAMRPTDLRKGDKGVLRKLPYTHLELTPAACLGVVASNIPFLNHNQSPRNTYQSAQSKQSVGIYSTSFRSRFDTMSFVLDYPQKPIVSTRMSNLLNVSSLPSGQNAILAIMVHTGYNQEDSVVISKAAVERGLLGCAFYRSYKETNSRNHSTGEEEHFYKPNPDGSGCAPKHMKHDKLAPTGFVPENTYVASGDAIIGKCMPQKVNGLITQKDVSVPIKDNEFGYIDANCYNSNRFPTTTSDGFSFCKVRIRQPRPLVVGDKVSEVSGQKGCVGCLLDIDEMPYSEDGITPDIIMNPHAIPSRMTISQLLEMVLGKSSCLEGEYGDCTPFNEDATAETVGKALAKYGYERYGNEVLYSPATGLPMEVHTFMGPAYYQRLKHMSVDKLHSRGGGGVGRVRAGGPVSSLTFTPSEGRSRQGGLRLGSMEADALLSNATTSFLRERMYDCSDSYTCQICDVCGSLTTISNLKDGTFKCIPCNNTTSFSTIAVPYCYKLLTQEIQALGIETAFNVKL
eukprot:jgi/Tetstr1/447241/TSEL_034678.t1